MNARAPLASIPISPLFPRLLRKWVQPIEPALQQLLVPPRITQAMESMRHLTDGGEFARSLLHSLGIRFAIEGDDLVHVAGQGALLAVANHPFGIVEGLVLMALFDRVRPDSRIVANSILAGVPALREKLILVNAFEGASISENVVPLRKASAWLQNGGMLTIFPAGAVASLNWMEQSVTDPPWKTTAARLARRARCPVLPIFFAGANSVSFHLAGTLHPILLTLSLAREFERLSGTTIRVRIGRPVPAGALESYRDPGEATAYLRSRTFFLANRSEPPFPPTTPPVKPVRTVAPPGSERLLTDEVTALPAASQLAGNSEFAVYLAAAAEIPRLLNEIGRCREFAFREAGEGTGESADLDRFDSHYQHLFLWNKKATRLAGAYRLAVTTDVLPRFGIDGLYTSTPYRFRPEFFQRIGPAVELGRSFVMPEYQKNYASLLLLWKGITRVVQRRPDAAVLFGAVSISSRYQAASRSLMINYLTARAPHELSQLVQPRRRFGHPVVRDQRIRRFAALAADIEDISLSIADIEQDSKGVPVLLRQYLKVGGRLLGFNLDPNFSDVLDALLVADLRTAPVALLERCMGRAEAKAFVAAQLQRRV
jgi:putative hemolysin